METLAVILSFPLLAMLLGKWAGKKGTGYYIIIAVVTALQVAAVFAFLFTMESPLT